MCNFAFQKGAKQPRYRSAGHDIDPSGALEIEIQDPRGGKCRLDRLPSTSIREPRLCHVSKRPSQWRLSPVPGVHEY